MKRFIALAAAVALCLSLAACNGKNNEKSRDIIFAGGDAAYSIVVSDEASETVRYAASELAEFVRRASGITLPIVKESVAKKPYISLGNTESFKSLGIKTDRAALNNDGYILRETDENLYVAAANDRGVLYGVYDFLEENVGVRFVAHDCTYVPTCQTLSFDEGLNKTKVPLFRYRNYYSGDISEYPEFAARLRFFSESTPNVGNLGFEGDFYRNETYGNTHNIFDYLRESEYPKSNPEYKDFYVSSHHSITTYDDVCYSNGVDEDGEMEYAFNEKKTVANIVLDSLIRFAETDTDAKYFMIGISDAADSYCDCERCSRRTEKYGGYRSANLILFMNLLARQLKTAFPQREINLIFFAYYWSEQPPVKEGENGYEPLDEKLVLEDNVYVRYAPIGANYAYSLGDSAKNGATYSTLRRWQALTDRFFLWDYNEYFNRYAWYFPNLGNLRQNVLWYREIGVEGLLQQAAYNEAEDWQSKLKSYVASKLYWDIDCSVGDLVEEFVVLYYGNIAAPYVLRFIDGMESRFSWLKETTNFTISALAGGNAYLSADSYPSGMLSNCILLLEKAIDEVKKSNLNEREKAEYIERIEEVSITPRMMLFDNYDAYYEVGKDDFAAKYFAVCESCGISRVGEHISLQQYRAAAGYNND